MIAVRTDVNTKTYNTAINYRLNDDIISYWSIIWNPSAHALFILQYLIWSAKKADQVKCDINHQKVKSFQWRESQSWFTDSITIIKIFDDDCQYEQKIEFRCTGRET